MVVNGLELPAAFVRAMRGGRWPGWQLKEEHDAYGNYWYADLELYEEMETIQQQTSELPKWFGPESSTEDTAELNEHFASEPGFIPLIDDFSKIVQFGEGGGDEPFCFDFRDDPSRPSVVYWDDAYWRRVAPDFETLMALFEPYRPSF